MINVDGSSIYENNGVKHFSYKFIVSQWVPNMRVHLSFTEPVANLEAHQGATVVDQYYYYGSSDDTLVIVQLDDAPHSAASSEFLIIGTGTNEMNMGITCTGNEAPPPSPPHPDDCTLGPQYHVRRQWPDGEEAELYFNTVGSPPPPQQAAAPATYTYSYDYDQPSEALDAPVAEPSKESADTLDDLLTSALVLLVLATGCCAAYQSRHTIKLRLDRLAATSSWARTIRNLMPAGASEAELSVFDDGAHDGELNDAARRAARKGRRGPSSTTRINPVDDHDEDEDEDADDDHDEPEPRAQPSRQAKDAAAAKKDADDDVFSTALVLRQGEMRELD